MDICVYICISQKFLIKLKRNFVEMFAEMRETSVTINFISSNMYQLISQYYISIFKDSMYKYNTWMVNIILVLKFQENINSIVDCYNLYQWKIIFFVKIYMIYIHRIKFDTRIYSLQLLVE